VYHAALTSAPEATTGASSGTEARQNQRGSHWRLLALDATQKGPERSDLSTSAKSRVELSQ
jgi:hypothetical protein